VSDSAYATDSRVKHLRVAACTERMNRHDVAPKHHVAVVGAGIAGLTAARIRTVCRWPGLAERFRGRSAHPRRWPVPLKGDGGRYHQGIDWPSQAKKPPLSSGFSPPITSSKCRAARSGLNRRFTGTRS
jgi:hypothetical protein